MVQIIRYPERIETRLGIDFKNFAIRVQNRARSGRAGIFAFTPVLPHRALWTFIHNNVCSANRYAEIILFPKIASAEYVAHVSVDRFPWREYRFFVRIFERCKDFGNRFTTLQRHHLIASQDSLSKRCLTSRMGNTKQLFRFVQWISNSCLDYKIR